MSLAGICVPKDRGPSIRTQIYVQSQAGYEEAVVSHFGDHLKGSLPN